MNGEFNLGQDIGELKADVRKCVDGIEGIKEHIEKLYGKDAENGKEIAVLKDNISLLQKVSWTVATVTIGIIVTALLKQIITK